MSYICNNFDFNENSSEIYLINNHGENNQYKTKGFYNIGNSCYINSFLQILFHIPNFIKDLKKEYEISNNKSAFIKNLIDLYETSNVKYLYSIQDYMENISSDYRFFHQGDSQNFGIDLINEIIKNIKGEENDVENDSEENSLKIHYKTKKMAYSNYIKKYQRNEISIEKMFLLNESLTINQKNNINFRFSTSLDIELVFPKYKKDIYTLKELLNLKYNINNMNYKKDNNSSSNKYLKTERGICKYPIVLIITISRSFIGNELNCSSLEFPEELNLSEFMDHDLIRKAQDLKYTLFSINEKIGDKKKFGHYICKIKEKDKWYIFNDTYVKDIFIKVNKPLISNNVVGLFYIKK
jgi:ubiquitin C-terminal hydrolase